MRFIYGCLMGVLATVIGAILYLAFADGDYLLQLSPRYHEMVSTIGALKEAKTQRDVLAERLDSLTASFNELTRRFNELRETGCETAQAPRAQNLPGPPAPSAPPAKAPESPAPKIRPEPSPTPAPAP